MIVRLIKAAVACAVAASTASHAGVILQESGSFTNASAFAQVFQTSGFNVEKGFFDPASNYIARFVSSDVSDDPIFAREGDFTDSTRVDGQEIDGQNYPIDVIYRGSNSDGALVNHYLSEIASSCRGNTCYLTRNSGLFYFYVSLNPGETFTYDLTVVEFAQVPEPATWAMMIGGFGLLGASARRRTRITTAFA